MKISLQIFWLLLWCWCSKVPVDQTQKITGTSEVTVRRWFEKFRLHMSKEKLESIRLSDIVQMDEAYRGGKKKGYAIIGAKESKREPAVNIDKRKRQEKKRRNMALQVLQKSSVDRTDALRFMHQYVVPESQFNTDGGAIYKGISNWWPVDHKYEIHKKFEFALTSEIEGLWGNFFTFIRRMYHHVTKEKMEDMAQEFTARSVFPEWFQSPEKFLQMSIKQIAYNPRLPGKPKKKRGVKNFEGQTMIIGLNNFIPQIQQLVASVNNN